MLERRVHTGGSDSARYCYSVWLRHLVMSFRNGLCARVPSSVAELGPGDSIGIGLAALLCGAERYYGLDVLPLANFERNLEVFEDLVALFRDRAPIPDDREFPGVKPKLSSYELPEPMRWADLDERRIERIRRSIREPNAAGSMIRYVAPWWSAEAIESGSVQMIFSQAVLEHVDDLQTAYASMRAWLAPGGWLSHQIDFRCHNTAHEWNGHWTYGPLMWRLLRGRRRFLINRRPHSTHVQLLRAADFEIICDQIVTGPGIERRRLALQFAELSENDLTTSGAFLQARPAG